MISPKQRRALSRELTSILNAPVSQALQHSASPAASACHRIGVTGPPGAGKSTLINNLAQHRSTTGTLAVLAIDPTSPISGGSLLGDRIRMDALVELPNLFVRSIPSRGARNGLCDNIVDLLCVLERYEFAEIILETVGVGQAEIDVRGLVDTMVLVVPPDAGDSIQAMKAGIIECADIFVMTKAENGAAAKSRSDIASILEHRISSSDGWMPRLILTERNGTGVGALDQAISAHRDWLSTHHNKAVIADRRRQAHLQDLIIRRLNEVLGTDLDIFKSNLQNAYSTLLHRMLQNDCGN